MYATADSIYLNDFVRDSQRSTQVVVSVKKIHQFLRALKSNILELISLIFPFQLLKTPIKFILNIFAFFILTAIVVIAVPCVWLFLRYFRYRLQKQSNIDIRFSLDNYADYRKSYDIINSFIGDLKDFNTLDLKDVPFGFRFLVKEIQKLSNIVCQFHKKLTDAFDDLDNSGSKSSLNIFTPISSQELWENRPKVYQYRF
jgi:hypothetical protein